MNWTANPKINIAAHGTGLCKKVLLTVRKMSLTIPWLQRKIFVCYFCTKKGLIKNFVKKVDKAINLFRFWKLNFLLLVRSKSSKEFLGVPRLSNFLKIRRLLNTKIVKQDWFAFQNLCENFLDSKKIYDYISNVKEWLSVYKAIGCNMSLKMHFLYSHQDFFPGKLGAVIDKHEGWFH